MRINKLALCTVTALCLSSATTVYADQDSKAFVEGETTLEARLLAPCCWAQTLDVHESELARSLRGEIRRRLQAGESAASVEDDIVARYGDKIRAVPKGKSLTGMGVWLSIAVAIMGLGAAWLVVRWVRRGRSKLPAPSTSSPAAADGYDDRLDAELRDLDE